jgi:hypothetical protein
MKLFYFDTDLTVPSLQGTLAKCSKPTLQPNFAKEPFRPSHFNDGLRHGAYLIDKQNENINRQCLTANIGKRGDSGCIQHPVSVSAFSSADTNELRKPRLPILADRYAPCKKTVTHMK